MRKNIETLSMAMWLGTPNRNIKSEKIRRKSLCVISSWEKAMSKNL